jgi:CDP-paratose 2-epimerase
MMPVIADENQTFLITGGVGFIGTNLAIRLLEEGHKVVVFDNFSRPGVEANWRELLERYGPQIRLIQGDMSDEKLLAGALACSTRVFHLAAQVAVTTSLKDPLLDFETNARGTLNLLEQVRKLGRNVPILFTSTNKVYGDLNHLDFVLRNGCYTPTDEKVASCGIDECRPIEFHSPYGCSKGAADQYVLDYARTYGLQTVVFRMSCIYGPHQFGTEDQGWVAHFLLQAMSGGPITLYGDGCQVRDVLFVDDLVEAMLMAQANIATLSGNAFNIGGGPENRISLLELVEMIGEIHGESLDVQFSDWRLADQKYYVSDISRYRNETGWSPRIPVPQGVERLYHWFSAHHRLVPESHLALGV